MFDGWTETLRAQLCILPYYRGYPLTWYYPDFFLGTLAGEGVIELGKPSSEILGNKIQSPPANFEPRPLMEEVEAPDFTDELMRGLKNLKGVYKLGDTGVDIEIYGGGF